MRSVQALQPIDFPRVLPDACTPATHASVEEGLALIDRGGPEVLSIESLQEDLRWFTAQQRFLEAMSARWLADLDRRHQQAPVRDPALAPGPWLMDNLKLGPNAAQAQLRTARALQGEMRMTGAALRRGEISWQHVGTIRRALESVPKTNMEP